MYDAPLPPVVLDLTSAPPVASPIDMWEWLRRFGQTQTGRFSCFPSFADLRDTETGTVVIVGGGPSLLNTLPRVREAQANGAKVFAVNASHDWLIAQGIVPDYATMGDARPWVDYITPRADVKYVLFSQLPGTTLERFLPFRANTFIAHNNPNIPITDGGASAHDVVANLYPRNPDNLKPLSFFDFGITTGITSLSACDALGFDLGECHGFDSSLRADGTAYAYPKPVTMGESYNITIADSAGHSATFLVRGVLEVQLREFERLMNLAEAGELSSADRPWRMKIRVAGEGAFPWMVRARPNSIFSVAP